MRVPGSNFLITDRPLDTITITRRGGEFIMAPPGTGPSPDKGFASYLVSTNPFKGLLLHVWMIVILYKKMRCILAKPCCFRDQRIFLHEGPGHLSPVRKIPGIHGGGGVIFEMLYV